MLLFPEGFPWNKSLTTKCQSYASRVYLFDIFWFHYKMTNMDFHSEMTYTGEILPYFFIGFPIWWMASIQRLCSENSLGESFSTGSTQATAPVSTKYPELSKGQDHLLRKKPVQLKNCMWEWLQKLGNHKPSVSWMPGTHITGRGYYIVRFRSYQRWQCDFLLAWKIRIQKISRKTHIWKKALPEKTRPPLQKKTVHDISSTLPSARHWKWGPKNEVSRLPSIVFILFAGAIHPRKLRWNLKMMGLQEEIGVHFSSSLVFRCFQGWSKV